MQIVKKENFTLITLLENELKELYNNILEDSNLEKEHLVVYISDDVNISNEDFLLFLSIAEQKKENGTSFVIVYKNINVDNFPETFNIVPTLQEAIDVLEMEKIERELGF